MNFNFVELKRRSEKWREERKAAMFEIPVLNKDEGYRVQRMLQYAGFRPFVITMGGEINVTLFLQDH